jgi:hypothetical protein
MAKDTDNRRGGFDVGETGGALSGLLAEEEELDRGAIWRLGTWAAVSVGAVIVALLTNQSSIGVRREQSASADLLKQAQQLQLTNRESQNETRRLSSAVDTLNGDRDRLYSRVAVLEQGLDSVTGAISRQSSTSPAPQAAASQVSASPVSASQVGPSQTGTTQAGSSPGSSNQTGSSQVTATQSIANTAAPTVSAPSALAAQTTSPLPAAPTTTASIDPSVSVVKPTPVPAAAPVATTAPAVVDKTAATAKQDKQDKQPATAMTSEPASPAKSMTEQQATAAQPSGSLVASKSMMGPPDPAAGKLLEPTSLPKIPPAASMPEVASLGPKASDEREAASSAAAPELVASRTEFGVDVGGANSIPGLRALWRGLLKSRSNTALAKLRPIIVIKENNNGLGMQLRLVAGPINDAAAEAKICASLTVSDRGCSTAVFEGQRLALGADEADKSQGSKAEIDEKPSSSASRSSSHRHYYSSRHPKGEDTPPAKPEPSTLSRLFGRRE